MKKRPSFRSALVFGVVAVVFLRAEVIGVRDVGFDVLDDLFDLRSEEVGVFDVFEHGGLVGRGEVEVPNLEKAVPKADFDRHGLNRGVVEITEIDADEAGTDDDALIGDDVFDVLIPAYPFDDTGDV